MGGLPSEPVLAVSAPSTSEPMNSAVSVPVRPATGSESASGEPARRSRSATRKAHVSRFSLLNPDASTRRTPSIGRPHPRSVASTTLRPPATVPSPLSATPSSLSNISAVSSSLVMSISRTTLSIGTDWTEASTPSPSPAVPVSHPCDTLTPRLFNKRTNSRAAARLGSLCRPERPSTRASLTMSASYGPASTPATPSPHDGISHSSSKRLPSPRTAPLIRVTPVAAMASASSSSDVVSNAGWLSASIGKSSLVSSGSPPPTR